MGEFDKFDGSDGLNLDEATGVNLKAGKNSAEAETKNLREANLTDVVETARKKACNGELNLNPNGAKIELVGEIYVGRGALKLKSFLAAYPLDARGKNALDVGSSTGGFVQILLQNGVKSVTALDVGSSQLDESLRADSRVIVAENTDVREFAVGRQSLVKDAKFDGSEQNLKIQIEPNFNPDKSNFAQQDVFLGELSKDALAPSNLTQIGAKMDEANWAGVNLAPKIQDAEPDSGAAKNALRKFDLITCDVSFISLKEILPSIDALAGENCDIILLFKPQFEVGRSAKRNKKGVVTDAKAVREARAKFELAAANLGWIMRQTLECEVKGKEGNAEFFYAFNKR
ncbi:SAM-dependent methyltransferase [Campylobacter showae]|uniref:SAM-dependent methyltransferase n=1 Tax=Campylobacter showae TaxID=204 RepID=UPI0028D3824C|nr:SAM-dependent methyltransferase [Campylobacter showae]